MKTEIQKMPPEQRYSGKNSRSGLKRKFKMKSTAMKYARVVQKAAAIAIAIGFINTIAFAGDANINGTMSNTGTFIIKGALTGSVKTIGGTVKFEKNGDQTIPADYTFEKLECTTGGNKTFAGTVTVSDYIKADAAAVNVSTYKLKVTSLNANAIQTANGGTVDFTAGEVEYSGAGAQTIYGATYKNLIIGSGGDRTANSNVQVTGLLTVNDNFIMNGASLLTLRNGASQPVFAGTKEVRGSMMWEAYLAQAYTFNNSSTVITFSGADGTRTFTVKSQPGTNPTNYLLGHSVKRTFNVYHSNWNTGTADVQLSYLQGELFGAVENKLRDFKNGIASANVLSGNPSARAASGPASFGYVKYTGLTALQLTSSSELAFDDQFHIVVPPPPPTSFISVLDAAWNIGSTWQGGVVPGPADDAVINTAVTIQDGNTYSVNSVTINTGAAVSLQIGGAGTGQLNVGAGGLSNNNAANANALDIRSNGVLDITGILTNNGGISNAGRITVQ